MNRRLVAVVTSAGIGTLMAVLTYTGRLEEKAAAFDLPPVAKQMAVFSQPPLDNRDVPRSVAEALLNLASTEQGVGIPAEVRLVGRGLGVNGVSAYVFPTTGGVVCLVVDERTSIATCVDSFSTQSGNVQWLIYSGTGTPQTVVGLASNHVASAGVVVKDKPRASVIENNAFFWQGSDDSLTREDIQGLVVRQTDGSVVRVDLRR